MIKPRINGMICLRHPELEGLRDAYSKRCIGCRRQNEKDQRETTARKDRERIANAARMREYRAEGKYQGNLQSHVKSRTPLWADKDKIAAIYKEAKRVGMSVDHDIPLRGKLVSGLHVENNLVLLPLSQNISKGNR